MRSATASGDGDESAGRSGSAATGPDGVEARTGGGAGSTAGLAPPGSGWGERSWTKRSDVVQGGIVPQLQRVVALDPVFLADGREQLRLLDGVDAEVGFEVEVHGQHLGRVAGLFGHQGHDALGHGVR